MSTKALRELLAEVLGCVEGPDCLHCEAWAEVEAIEQACRDWYAQETRRGVVLASDALAPFERIALETKP